jgi:mRNA interferase HigB
MPFRRRLALVVVIALSRLRQFWAIHPDAETSLRAWYKVALAADWAKFADVRATCGVASAVGHCTAFNVAGNEYRLATRTHYKTRTTFVLRVTTRAEYDDQE